MIPFATQSILATDPLKLLVQLIFDVSPVALFAYFIILFIWWFLNQSTDVTVSLRMLVMDDMAFLSVGLQRVLVLFMEMLIRNLTRMIRARCLPQIVVILSHVYIIKLFLWCASSIMTFVSMALVIGLLRSHGIWCSHLSTMLSRTFDTTSCRMVAPPSAICISFHHRLLRICHSMRNHLVLWW